MSKEKFVRTHPHVNIGLILLVIVTLTVIGFIVVPSLLDSEASPPPQIANATPAPSLVIEPTPSATAGPVPAPQLTLADINAYWVLYRDSCGIESYALRTSFVLRNEGPTPVPMPGADVGLLMLLIEPVDPNREDGLLQNIAVAVIPELPGLNGTVPGTPQTTSDVLAGQEELQIMVELTNAHPDFLWLPTGSSGGGSQTRAGDVLLHRWQENVISHISPKDPPADLKNHAQVVVILLTEGLPEIAGLFRDTAEGETGRPVIQTFSYAGAAQFDAEFYEYPGEYASRGDGPAGDDTGMFWFFDPVTWDTSLAPEGQQVGAVYKFILNGDGGGLLLVYLSSGLPADGGGSKPPLVVFQWGDWSHAQFEESDLDFLSRSSMAAGRVDLGGLSTETEMIEYKLSASCPTMTPEVPTQALAIATPTPNITGGSTSGSEPATATNPPRPTDTPQPPKEPTETRPAPTPTPEREMTTTPQR